MTRRRTICKYEQLLPASHFPYKISKRIEVLSLPRRTFEPPAAPKTTPAGVRVAALKAHISDRVNEAAYPYTPRLITLRNQYKSIFPPERLERINRTIELANSTMYAKLADRVLALRGKTADHHSRRKKGWGDTDWKKHMEYIGQIAGPRKEFELPPVDRGPKKPLSELIDHLQALALMPENKMYRRLSQENWYHDPRKISPAALKYVATDKIKEMAKPKRHPEEDYF